ncbi:MAG: RNA polymerase sigma-70 factor [Elainella sp.]
MDRLELFSQHRALLFAIAYRMLGSVVDAEDMVQETFLRWQGATEPIHAPKTYLAAITTRLCIDYLRSARIQRERYVGSWLPEPLISNQVEALIDAPTDPVELADSLSFAFLTLLECLTPTERAIFLLREVFDYDYAEIAQIVGKTPPNCRQILRRARQHLARRPALHLPIQQRAELTEQFLTCWQQGDLKGLMTLMAEDVTFWSDGGGKAVAAQKPLHGAAKVARFLIAIQQSRILPRLRSQIVQINGQAGILNWAGSAPQSTISLHFVGQQVQTIFAVVNPDKLRCGQIRADFQRSGHSIGYSIRIGECD